jgi:hypothetical protein
MQQRIAELEDRNTALTESENYAMAKASRLDAALGEIKEYFGRDFDRYQGLVEIYRKAREGE